MPLSQAEIEHKQSALEAHRTQYESNGRYLSSFIRANELFGDYEDTVLPRESAEQGLEQAAPAERVCRTSSPKRSGRSSSA